MPQQFLRSKRNNLRFVNNYKRDHFTQSENIPTLLKNVSVSIQFKGISVYRGSGDFKHRYTLGKSPDARNSEAGDEPISQPFKLELGPTDFKNLYTGSENTVNMTGPDDAKDLGKIKAKVEDDKLVIWHKLPEEYGLRVQLNLARNHKDRLFFRYQKDVAPYKRYDVRYEEPELKPAPPAGVDGLTLSEWNETGLEDIMEWRIRAPIPARPKQGADVEFILENGTPTLKIYTEDTFYVEYFDDANQILNNGQGEEKGKGDYQIPGVKKVKISRQNDVIRSKSLTLNNPVLEGVALEWKDHIGGSGSITNCAHVNSARNMLGLGSDFDCQETFMQRPNNFPHSKVDDFSQDWEALLTKFDSDLGAIGSGIGSYTSSRDDILGEILTAVKAGDYRGVQLITDMSSGLYAAAQSIEDKVQRLEDIKQDFDDIRGSGLGKYDRLITKARAGMN